MRRRELLLGSGLLAATTIAGCLGGASGDDEGTPPDASTQQVSSEDSRRTVTVRSSGEVAAEPDLADLRVGVEVIDDDAATVRDELSRRASELEAGLLAYGIDEDDVTTDQFRVRDRYDHAAMREDGVEPRTEAEAAEYRYYVGTHAFSVDVHDVDDVGGVIDAAIDAGADEIGRIDFTLSDDRRDELREEALEAALEDARVEADLIAAEIGATVLEASHVDTSGADVSPVRERFDVDEAADAAPTTQLHPDDVTVRASVTVEYEVA